VQTVAASVVRTAPGAAAELPIVIATFGSLVRYCYRMDVRCGRF
jgi:hypothetical protein